eukprot:TRINITY_DN22072_c0_g1_i1.p1 TRINITY_DN22072_c0_g1~~TRINITY_DN22072_c0_g1_i1.p1  ORF type:complete len:281 (-),score=62.71 TRINITY_DN22072_c0_g1_i1:71-913(-)
MLARDTVQARMASEEGCSLMELCYQTIQAYDFWHLHQHHNCILQVGGSDQWGNIVAGMDLIRRKSASTAYGLTVPLVTSASGDKLGKSSGNAIWLDPTLTPSFEFYQYFLNLDDDTAARLLPQLSLDPIDQIEELVEEHVNSLGDRLAQRALAEQVTRTVHGVDALNAAVRATKAFFGGSSDELEVADVQAAAACGAMPRKQLEAGSVLGSTVLSLLSQAGVTSSNAEGKRLIKSGGLYLNNVRVIDAAHKISDGDLLDGSLCVLRTGKKKFFLLHITSD